jgi:hypothetical protein
MIKLVLFFNNQSNGSTNAPYFTGKLTMEDGTELKAALWTNVSAAGVTYYSGHAKPFEPNPAQVQAEGYRNYTPPTAPAQPEPAPATPEPPQDQPADPEFIQETIKEWEDRTKADIPDLGRRRLDPPRDVAETNKFWLKSQYMLAKELIYKVEESNLDILNEEMFAQYKLAQATVKDWEIKHPNELFQPNR